MTEILITGATGFVGANFLSYIKDGNIKVHRLNLREDNWEQNLPESYTTIIHLAGKAHDLKKVSKPEEYYKVNFELTKRLYDIFLKSNASTFIFVSSVKAVADVVNGSLTEEVTPDPKTDYGKSKLMAEEYIISQPSSPGKSFYILRPCMIHGPGNKGNLNLLYQFVQKSIPYPLAAFENKRSFLSVENLCFVMKHLLKENSVLSGIYQVADDEPLSTNEVVELLARASGRKLFLWKLPVSFIQTIAVIGDRLRLPLNSESLKKLTENYVVSNDKIKKALQENLPLSSRAGLLKTASSFGSDK